MLNKQTQAISYITEMKGKWKEKEMKDYFQYFT